MCYITKEVKGVGACSIGCRRGGGVVADFQEVKTRAADLQKLDLVGGGADVQEIHRNFQFY